MSMDIVGLTILILAVAGIVAAGIYLLVSYLNDPDLPEGRKFTFKEKGIKLFLVVDKEIAVIKSKGEVTDFITTNSNDKNVTVPLQTLKNSCFKAIKATNFVMSKKGFGAKQLKKVVVQFQPERKFEKPSVIADHDSSYAWDTKSSFGKGYPLAVIRFKYMSKVKNEGQPLIHELIHLLLDKNTNRFDNSHQNKKLWEKYGKDTVEYEAKNKFRKV